MLGFTSDFLLFHRTKFKVMSEMEMREGGNTEHTQQSQNDCEPPLQDSKRQRQFKIL